MARTFSIKRNDRLPTLATTLTNADGSAVDLEAAQAVRFKMRLRRGTELKVDAEASFGDRAAGEVEYAWAAGDTDTAGLFVAEFEVEWEQETALETYPSGGYIAVVVLDDVEAPEDV